MIIYEVNIDIDPSIEKEYIHWLKSHIDQILKIDGFSKAEVYQREAENQKKGITVHYYLETKEKLDDYLTHFAPKLRQEALDKFGSQFSASRRILSVFLRSFPSK